VGRHKKHKTRRDERLLLVNLAQVLNACDEAGLHVKLKHGVVFSDVGYVLPIKDKWRARMLRRHAALPLEQLHQVPEHPGVNVHFHGDGGELAAALVFQVGGVGQHPAHQPQLLSGLP
jgi:hypothetical protein